MPADQINPPMDKKGLFNFPIFNVQLHGAENYTAWALTMQYNLCNTRTRFNNNNSSILICIFIFCIMKLIIFVVISMLLLIIIVIIVITIIFVNHH